MSSSAPYSIELTRSARKGLDKAPRHMQGRLRAAIDALAYDPRPHGCEKMSGYVNTWRIREGEWRVVYEVYEKHLQISVVEVGPRGSVYAGW